MGRGLWTYKGFQVESIDGDFSFMDKRKYKVVRGNKTVREIVYLCLDDNKDISAVKRQAIKDRLDV